MENPKVNRILVVDDHPIVQEGLQRLLSREKNLEVCGFAKSVSEAISKIGKLLPDLVIVDIGLKGGLSGLELVREIKKNHANIKTLVLSMHDEDLYAGRSIKAGAQGYLMKEELRSTIVEAILKILGGEIYLSESVKSKFVDEYLFNVSKGEEINIEKLSDRELEVFQLIGKGYKTGEIAEALGVSVKTVGTHKLRIQQKFRLKGSASLMKWAIEWNQNNT